MKPLSSSSSRDTPIPMAVDHDANRRVAGIRRRGGVAQRGHGGSDVPANGEGITLDATEFAVRNKNFDLVDSDIAIDRHPGQPAGVRINGHVFRAETDENR